jgi:hypothetical protein
MIVGAVKVIRAPQGPVGSHLAARPSALAENP